jgi:hypothetical protein
MSGYQLYRAARLLYALYALHDALAAFLICSILFTP